jgi:hypothetical protein
LSTCIVPGCKRAASNNLGVRLRKPDTSAIWAFETAAHVCDVHARCGARIHVVWESTTTRRVEFSVQGAGEPIVRRTRAIRH